MSWLRNWVVSSGWVRMLLLPLVFGPAGCAQPIRLNPPQAESAPPIVLQPRRVVRAASVRTTRQSADAADPACASRALHGLTAPRKAELFRRFAELEGGAGR